MNGTRESVFVLAAALLLSAQPATSQGLPRSPHISADRVVFVSGGHIWIAHRPGGTARRLTTGSTPRLSPDGQSVAFSRNGDIYVIPANDGAERRLTWHPGIDSVMGWTPDGQFILDQTDRTSALPSTPRLFLVPVEGGMPVATPMPRALFSSFAPDGKRLAYSPNPEIAIYANWSRYRGGSLARIAIYDLEHNHQEELPRVQANDMYPMWYGDAVYFVSDQGGVVNLYACDLRTKARRKLTNHTDWDIREPSLGPDAIVYENGGRLYEYQLATGQTRPMVVNLPSIEVSVEERGVFKKVFREAWQNYRDHGFYVPSNWDALRAKYEPLTERVADRGDLQAVLRAMLAEAGVSHNRITAPGSKARTQVTAGLLGAEFSAQRGCYRVDTVFPGGPLAVAGVKVGEYLVSVNGTALRPPGNLYAALEGTTGKSIRLLIEAETGDRSAREVAVTPVGSERALRYAAWTGGNAALVSAKTNGAVAYMHLPDTDPPSIELVRKAWPDPRQTKAMIVDARYNAGGARVDYFLEVFGRRGRRVLVGDSGSKIWPLEAIHVPKVLLVNGQSASGGDELAFFWKREKIGPVVGTRTYGAMLANRQPFRLSDGSMQWVPQAGFFLTDTGEWYPENYGVEPDFVVEDHAGPASCNDPQLEKAIAIAIAEMRRWPEPKPAQPWRPRP